LETAYALRDDKNASDPKTRISVRHLFECDFSNRGCNGGGQAVRLWKYMKEYGYSTWQDYGRNEPADTPTSMNVRTCIKYSIDNLLKADDVTPVALKNPSVDTLKNILLYQTVVATFEVDPFSPVYQYKSGVFTDPDYVCSSKPGDSTRTIMHMVNIVGYQESNEVQGCSGWWIVKNSWGPKWGENGYMRVCIPSDESLYPYGVCNIMQSIQYPDVGIIPKASSA
jgi:Papain family cysteine protease